jgi:hypothetical protein
MRKFFLILGSAVLAGTAFGQNCTTSSSSAWTSTPIVPAQTGLSTTQPFTITPTGPSVPGGPDISISQAAATAYPQASSLIRQSATGTWEVYDGAISGFHSDVAVQWVVGTPATFTWTIDVPNQQVTVNITQAGTPCATGCTLAANYKFRAPATSIGFWNLDATATPLTVCSFGFAAPPPPPPPPPPMPPTVVSILANVSVALACGTTPATPMHNVVLNWNASTTAGVTSYNVYRSIINGSGYAVIGTTGGVLTFTDATVASGTIYYYVVTAVSPNGESVFSNQASASIP